MAKAFDAEKIRDDFPIFKRRFAGRKLAYLDNAASTQKPKAVIDAVSDFYSNHYANVHRSVSTLAMEATDAFENARKKVASYVGGRPEEIIFTRNATESLNLAAYAWSDANVQAGDVVVVTEMDHHSNLVPWQQMALRKKAQLHYIPVIETGELDAEFEFPENTKVFAFPHASNVMGTVNDVTNWTKKAKIESPETVVVVDGAAGAPHFQPDLPKTGADFYAFSGHKMLGPIGSGILWAKKEILESMPPFLYGGSMIARVEKHATTWADIPARFEAGTPDVADAIGLSVAIDYLQKIGLPKIHAHELKLAQSAQDQLEAIPGVTTYGPASNSKNRVGIVSFNVEGVHAHDVGSILDSEAVAIRSGHHCAQVLMDRLNVPATARASFYLYNTEDDVDRLVAGVKKVSKIFKA